MESLVSVLEPAVPSLARLLAPSALSRLESLRGARILVTGGSGFLGGWALSALAAADEYFGLKLKMIALTRTPAQFIHRSALAQARTVLVGGDITALPEMPEPPTHILHAAAPPHIGTSAQEFDRVIVGGTSSLLAAAARWGTRRILFISSGAVYGAAQGHPRAETEVLAGPTSPYGEAKRRAEELCARTTGIDIVRARGFAFLGPGIPLDGSFAAGDLLLDAVAGGPLRLRSTGASVRTFLDAEESGAWNAVMLAAGVPGAVYNFGGETPVRLADLARLIARRAGIKEEAVLFGDDSRSDVYVPDVSSVRNSLDLFPRVDLAESIDTGLEWVRRGAPGARRP